MPNKAAALPSRVCSRPWSVCDGGAKRFALFDFEDFCDEGFYYFRKPLHPSEPIHQVPNLIASNTC